MTVQNQDFIFNSHFEPFEGEVFAKAPSNIALIKYWGKSHPQLPKNASVSFTLTNSYTETTLKFKPKNADVEFEFEVILDGVTKLDFKPKIQKYFESIVEFMPFLKAFSFEIHTHNSFPHSSGIASSASSFAALSLCLMQIEKTFNSHISDDFYYKKAAFLARLGSGSATRSVYSNLVLWGKHPDFEGSSDLFGIPFPVNVDSIFEHYQDTILLVDKGQKKVSSTVGHNLMNNHPFANQRFEQANTNLTQLANAMRKGNINEFIRIVETEALSLHAMMMTANPNFILMQPNTLAIIHHVWDFRDKTDLPLCFTLDAGANVHLLYPKNISNEVIKFIDETLSTYCENNQYICDGI